MTKACLAASWMLARSPGPVLSLLEELTPEVIWAADYPRLRLCGLNEGPARRLLALRRECPIEELEHGVEAAGQTFISRLDGGYPRELLHLDAPPAGLFRLGSDECWREIVARPRITIVGTRRASHYGLEVARLFARSFARRGVVVVSGMARGIDGAAHDGALEAGGVSVAVLGGGADVVYPAGHGALHRRLVDEGAVISEMPPGIRPRRWSFPLRNRLLAALSHGTVVIEVGERSGGLITCRNAADMGRTVYVVPGPILGPTFRGSHGLIADGATMAVDPEEVMEDFARNARIQLAEKMPPTDAGLRVSDVSGEGREAVDRLVETALAADCLTIDQVIEAVGCTAREAVCSLTRLELTERVARTGPGRYGLRA